MSRKNCKMLRGKKRKFSGPLQSPTSDTFTNSKRRKEDSTAYATATAMSAYENKIHNLIRMMKEEHVLKNKSKSANSYHGQKDKKDHAKDQKSDLTPGKSLQALWRTGKPSQHVLNSSNPLFKANQKSQQENQANGSQMRTLHSTAVSHKRTLRPINKDDTKIKSVTETCKSPVNKQEIQMKISKLKSPENGAPLTLDLAISKDQHPVKNKNTSDATSPRRQSSDCSTSQGKESSRAQICCNKPRTTSESVESGYGSMNNSASSGDDSSDTTDSAKLRSSSDQDPFSEGNCRITSAKLSKAQKEDICMSNLTAVPAQQDVVAIKDDLKCNTSSDTHDCNSSSSFSLKQQPTILDLDILGQDSTKSMQDPENLEETQLGLQRKTSSTIELKSPTKAVGRLTELKGAPLEPQYKDSSKKQPHVPKQLKEIFTNGQNVINGERKFLKQEGMQSKQDSTKHSITDDVKSQHSTAEKTQRRVVGSLTTTRDAASLMFLKHKPATQQKPLTKQNALHMSLKHVRCIDPSGNRIVLDEAIRTSPIKQTCGKNTAQTSSNKVVKIYKVRRSKSSSTCSGKWIVVDTAPVPGGLISKNITGQKRKGRALKVHRTTRKYCTQNTSRNILEGFKVLQDHAQYTKAVQEHPEFRLCTKGNRNYVNVREYVSRQIQKEKSTNKEDEEAKRNAVIKGGVTTSESRSMKRTQEVTDEKGYNMVNKSDKIEYKDRNDAMLYKDRNNVMLYKDNLMTNKGNVTTNKVEINTTEDKDSERHLEHLTKNLPKGIPEVDRRELTGQKYLEMFGLKNTRQEFEVMENLEHVEDKIKDAADAFIKKYELQIKDLQTKHELEIEALRKQLDMQRAQKVYRTKKG